MKKIGRYVIISELGRGAMGVVYKASDPTIGREVALKVLSLNPSPGEGTNSPQEMFMREVRAAGRLAHPSIVTIHDAFEDAENQTSCIVMELVPGVTLEKILDSGQPLTIEQVLYLVRQVVEGLDYAHRNQVIHRDLKPANILVTADGRAKITDFGIAKVLAREGMARTVGMMGTPSYMSPEQVKGGEVDGRTDIFSLGIIIFTMLSGKKPFTGNTAAVMFKIVYEEPPVPSSLNPGLPPAYDYVVKKCLAKDRNLRYASARELLGDLDDLQHGRPPRSQVAAPASGGVPPASPLDRTLDMPISGLMKAVSHPPSARPTPPAPPSAQPKNVAAQPPKPALPPPVVPEKEDIPSPFAQTLNMPIQSLMKGALQPPSRGIASATPASPPVSVQPPRTAIPPPVTPTLHPETLPLSGQTLPTRAPNLSATPPPVSPPPQPAPTPYVPYEPTLLQPTIPVQVPEHPTASQAVGPQPVTPARPPQPAVTRAEEPAGASGAVFPAPKLKLIPVVFGGVAVVLLAAAMWGYWKFHRTRTASSPPPQAAVQTQPATPPQIPTPIETPTPPPAAVAEQPTPPVSSAPAVAKKPTIRKTKQAPTPPPPAPEPTPPPVQPQPVAPPPKPAPPTPSPEDIAKAEAARLAKIPRIVQVVCNYGLKEATFVFSASGKPLFQETLKGKKVKGGFLGIKGSYQGTFTHTITVPAGTPLVSIRIMAKDGGMDQSKDIMMPPPGGFVPTLGVDVDSDHLSLNWKSSSAAK